MSQKRRNTDKIIIKGIAFIVAAIRHSFLSGRTKQSAMLAQKLSTGRNMKKPGIPTTPKKGLCKKIPAIPPTVIKIVGTVRIAGIRYLIARSPDPIS